MNRWAVLLTLAACDASQPSATSGPVVRWVYPPPPTVWPLGPVIGRFGRGQTPQPIERLGIDQATNGAALAPLRLPTPWAVPGDGPARAVIYGSEGEHTAVELIDVDSGRVAWRDHAGCAAPIVGVTAEAIVCADATGIRAIGLDGKPRWKRESPFVALTDDRVVTAGAGEAIVLDANSGDELTRVKLPTGISADAVVASCGDAGRELFAVDSSGAVGRIAEAKGGPKLAWHTAVGGVVQIDACAGGSILVTASLATGPALISLDRATGAITGRIDGVRGVWPARDGDDRVEVSAASGVTSRARDLRSDVRVLDLPALGDLLDKRGERRLVRVTATTAAVLDRNGVRAYVPLGASGGVLGDKAIVYASWTGSPSETVHRIALPTPWHHTLRSLVSGPLAVPAELRDLPPVSDVAAAAVYANPDSTSRQIGGIAIDPADSQALYIADIQPGLVDSAPALIRVARFDLETATWRPREDPCGTGAAVGIAFATTGVICATRDRHDATVTATARDGTHLWTASLPAIDAIAAAGDIVAVFEGDTVHVLDAANGTQLGSLASDDGAAMRAVPLAVGGGAVLVTVERGRLVSRVPHVRMLPVWSIEVAGAVHLLTAAGDGVLVALEDGDAYRVDVRGTVAALPAIGLAWGAAGDVMTGVAPGGPIPPSPLPIPKLPPPIAPPLPPPPPTNFEPPPIATPWPPPPAMRASWQSTLFELDGGVRARNDYALAEPVVAGPRGEAPCPFVVSYGSEQSEALVIDARTGDPLRRVRMPDDVTGALVFGAVVAGKPVAGAVVAAPLRVVLF